MKNKKIIYIGLFLSLIHISQAGGLVYVLSHSHPRFQHSVVNTYLNLLLNSIVEITLRLL